ncbi:MAG: hypothetical protein RJA46_1325, partial [Pseudomonadota bacterium]
MGVFFYRLLCEFIMTLLKGRSFLMFGAQLE